MNTENDEIRRRILETSQDVLMEHGFLDESVDHVVEAAGISRQTFFCYFKDISDLSFSILGKLFKEIDDRGEWFVPEFIQNSSLSAAEKLKQYFLLRWSGESHIRERRFMAEFDAYYSGSRVILDFNSRIEELLPGTHVDTVKNIFKQGQSEGSIRVDLDPHLTVVTLMNSIRGLDQRLILRGDSLVELRPGEKDSLQVELITLLIQGISTANHRT